MGGQLGEALNGLAEGFNKSQKDYKVVPVYKGTYTETMTGAIAAFRAKQQPHIVQVFEVGTATMMAAKGAIYPVHQLMADAGEAFDPDAYLPAVYGYYSTTDGKLLSMPFNSSTPVLYYNKDAFKKAGLDPDKPPKTWSDMEQYAKKLLAAGYQCGFTSQWQTWIQIENFGAWHNIPFATGANGFAGTDIKLTINDPLRVRHVENLAKWQKEKVFVYAGREGKPNPKFTTGECPMIMASAGSAGGFAQAMKDVQFGIAMLPYYADVSGAPQNSIIGGATLWVLSGKPKNEYKGVAKFFSLPVQPRSPVEVAHGDRLRADHQGGLSAYARAGLLRQVPRPRRGGGAAQPQAADRQFQGPAHRQFRADPRRDGRGARGGMGRSEDGEAGARCGRRARQQAACRLRARQQVARWRGRPPAAVEAGGACRPAPAP